MGLLFSHSFLILSIVSRKNGSNIGSFKVLQAATPNYRIHFRKNTSVENRFLRSPSKKAQQSTELRIKQTTDTKTYS